MIAKTKTKLKALGFTGNHFALIGASVFALALIMLVQEPLTLQNLFTLKFLHADNETKQSLSYEDAVAKADAAVTDTSGDADKKISDFQKQQLSLLDPNFGGSVLGVSTEDQQYMDDLLSDRSLNQIPVKTVADTSDSQNKYVVQSRLIESSYGSIELIGMISSEDPVASAKTLPYFKGMIIELKQLQVPNAFAKYHRIKLMYYSTLMKMAETISTNSNSDDRSAAGTLFFEVGNQLEAERANLQEQYGAQL